MKEKGQSQIVAGVVIISLLVVGAFLLLPQFGIDTPKIPGVSETYTYATFDVNVCAQKLKGTAQTTLDIKKNSIVYEDRNAVISIGGWASDALFFWEVDSGTIQVDVLKNGTIVNGCKKGYEIEWGMAHDYHIKNLKIGIKGTGEYKIRVSIYSEMGTMEDRGSITVQI